MASYLYNFSSLWIALVLLLVAMGGIHVGYLLGKRAQPKVTKKLQSQINAILASMIGMLALILGFTFSQSLERYDSRSTAVIDEANAIGTAYFCADLVPAVREESQKILREYLDLRVRAASMSKMDPTENQLLEQAEQKHNEIWQQVKIASQDRDDLTALFAESVNEMIDSFGRRKAAIFRHVPEVIILLLMLTFVLSSVVVGVSSGAEGHRPSATAYAMVILIVLLILAIIDLDRPRRGFIEVSHQSLIELQDSIESRPD